MQDSVPERGASTDCRLEARDHPLGSKMLRISEELTTFNPEPIAQERRS
jgi:hypothetical protein